MRIRTVHCTESHSLQAIKTGMQAWERGYVVCTSISLAYLLLHMFQRRHLPPALLARMRHGLHHNIYLVWEHLRISPLISRFLYCKWWKLKRETGSGGWYPRPHPPLPHVREGRVGTRLEATDRLVIKIHHVHTAALIITHD